MHLFLITIKKINAYFKGANVDLNFLNHYDARLLQKDFYTLQINSNPDLIVELKSILATLAIPENKWSGYFDTNTTAYEFFLQLSRENYIQANYIIDLLHVKHKSRFWHYMIGGVFFLCFLATLLTLPAFASILTILNMFVFSPVFLPILGLSFNLGWTAYNIYTNQADRKRTIVNRFRDNIFLILNSIVTFTAYVIWISSLSIMTPLVACLFVTASMVDIAKELFSLAMESINYRVKQKHFNALSQEGRCARIRHNIQYQKHSRAALISMAAAVILMGVMAAWCFAYGSILITISALAAITVIYFVRGYLLKKSEESLRKGLQKQLKSINDAQEMQDKINGQIPVFKYKNISSQIKNESKLDLYNPHAKNQDEVPASQNTGFLIK